MKLQLELPHERFKEINSEESLEEVLLQNFSYRTFSSKNSLREN